jgi:hypothetical protein
MALRNITIVKFALQHLLQILCESGVCVMDCTANVSEVLVISVFKTKWPLNWSILIESTSLVNVGKCGVVTELFQNSGIAASAIFSWQIEIKSTLAFKNHENLKCTYTLISYKICQVPMRLYHKDRWTLHVNESESWFSDK